MVDELLVGFVLAHQSEVEQKLVPETGIDKVSGGVFGSAHIQIHLPPVFVGLLRHQFVIVVRVHVAQVIGARTGKSRHGAGFQGIAVFGLPVLGACQGRLALFGGQVFVHFGQQQRQFVVRKGMGDAVLVVNRERFAPIALTAENGVPQAVVDLRLAQAAGFDFLHHTRNGILDAEPVQELGVDERAVFGFVGFLFDVAARHYLANGQIEVFGEAVVAAVVGRHRHNCARAVAGQYVFRNPDGQFLARKRVQGVGARKHAAHLVHFRLTLAFGAVLGVVHVGFHFRLLFGRGEGLDGFVFGAEHHEADPEKRVGACGEYPEAFGNPLGLGMVDFKAHFRAHAAANPVALHFLERVAPFQGVQTVQEALGVGGDTQRPLFHQLAFHGETTAFGEAVHHFVVGQHRAQLRAPVHHRIRKEGQAVVHQNVGTFLFVE